MFLSNKSKQTLTILFHFYFKDAENSTVLNDEVYAIEMGTEMSNLSDALSLTFKTNQVFKCMGGGYF